MRTAVHRLLGRKAFLVARLLALFVLFFVIVVWLYYAYAPSILSRVAREIGRPDVVAEEFARLDSLGSFLSALFQGNLGFSFLYGQPVWSILAERLGMTVLLIVISIAVSAATGALVASLAARFRQKGYKPLTYAYSLRGYFFSLITWAGFILIMLFSVRLGWFPSAHSVPDYWVIHPPENVFVEIEGRLMHLALPVLTLAIIFLIRSFFVVWSGSIRFTSGKTLRNLLLPSTVTDFACVISAVVLIEYAYFLPGVGLTLFMNIGSGDLNMLVGAFLMLLAIAIVLGYLGVFLDFIRQRYGLLNESEKEVHARTENKERPARSASNRKLRSLLRLLLDSKSVFLGLIIVSAFIIIGLTAPFLSPHDPVSTIQTPKIAYKFSKPVWYKYLYPNENLSENIDATSDPNFNSAETINELSLETSLADAGAIHTEYISDRGFQEGSGPGCMAIVFSRDAGVTPYGEVKANLTVTFDYPYSFPPQQFSGQVAVLVVAPQGVSRDINVFLEKTGSSRIILWSDGNFETHADGWTTPYPSIDSGDLFTKDWLRKTLGAEWYKSPAAAMFSESGEYRFTVEVTFEDIQPGANNVTVFVDDFSMRLYGNSFGLLGTDEYGRDVYSQILYGARNTLIIAVPIAAVAAVVGLALGFAACNLGNLIDNIVRLFVDTTLALPVVPLLVVITWALRYSPLNWALLWVLSALAAMASRMAFVAHRNERASMSSARWRRLLNLFKDFSAIFCFVMASLILLTLIGSFVFYSSLLRLDFEPTWGGMLARTLHTVNWMWLWVPPLSCLLLFAVGFLLIGMGLDERV